MMTRAPAVPSQKPWIHLRQPMAPMGPARPVPISKPRAAQRSPRTSPPSARPRPQQPRWRATWRMWSNCFWRRRTPWRMTVAGWRHGENMAKTSMNGASGGFFHVIFGYFWWVSMILLHHQWLLVTGYYPLVLCYGKLPFSSMIYV